MKKVILLFTFIILTSCIDTSIKSMEKTLGFELPYNHIILKDTIEGNIDNIVNIQVQFPDETEIKKLINSLNEDYEAKSINFGYEFSLLSKDVHSYNCLVKIDTLNSIISFKEFHY